MRTTLPISGREHVIAANSTLMSTTDVRGNITFANAAFIEVSGFALDELLGQPHNLVRHPDMPTAAFADMWKTLAEGYSWSALVKNRRKNGDHYWVRANATPVLRNGTLAGYMSVRTTPSRAEVAAAEKLYADLRAGRAGGVTLRRGVLVRTGPLSILTLGKTLPVRWRIRGAVATFAAAMLFASYLVGVRGASLASFGVLAALGVVVFSGLLEAQIAQPLARVLKHALGVAAGHTEPATELDRVDEIGMLFRAVNQAGLNVRSLVDDVGVQILGLEGATVEITDASDNLRARTESAAASLQETAASMEELTATVKTNADSAREATSIAQEASVTAARSGTVMSEAVGMMQQVTAASQKIADITTVMDGLAFQTNMLALNATVEAARAAEHGRGFAVVANEVRVLAQRSAEASRQIKSLITESAAKVDAGARLVEAAGTAMGETVARVRGLAELIQGISQATMEQSEGLDQINIAVAELDKVTQENAALAEQTTAAAAAVSGQAGRLGDAVDVFEDTTAAPSPRGNVTALPSRDQHARTKLAA